MIKRKVVDKKETNLKVFKELGFSSIKETGDNKNVVGTCIFCGKKKMYVNWEIKTYHCKVCNEQGGYQNLLDSCTEFFCQDLQGDKLQDLVDSRGLDAETFKAHNMGYNYLTNEYTIPIYDDKREHVLNIKKGRLNKKSGKIPLFNLSGSNSSLFGSHSLMNETIEKVFLVEGEWDKMTMWEALQKEHVKDTIVVSVPSATIFKDHWIDYFANRHVSVFFDNDHNRTVNNKVILGAGKSGAIKIYKLLSSFTKSIQFIHWSKSTPNKYDVRDYYLDNNKDPKLLIKNLLGFCQSIPMDIEHKKGSSIKDSYIDGGGCSSEKVYEVYNKWLMLKNNNTIDILFGSIIGNRIPNNPIWIFLVGRSGFCKSEFLMSLNDVNSVYSLSSLTPNALISGSKTDTGDDPSLINRLNKKNLVVKDFTTILEMEEASRRNILSTLRDAYDGETSRAYGSHERRYKVSFGFVAGVTPIIEMFSSQNPIYGERFLSYRMNDDLNSSSSMNLIAKTLENNKNSGDMKKELRDIAVKCLHTEFNFVELSSANNLQISALAQMTAILRASILRDKYNNNELLMNPVPEIGTRIGSQLQKLALGIMAFKGKKELDKEIIDLLMKVVLSTIPDKYRFFLSTLQVEKSFNVQKLCTIFNCNKVSLVMIVKDLILLKVLEITRQNTYYISDEFKYLFVKSGFIPKKQ
jgi:hypothetical protein